MSKLLEYVMSASHRRALANAHRGKHHSTQTKKKISNTMAGTSNFAGQKHKKISKERISSSRGHDDRIQGKKWIVTRVSGKTYRKHGLPDTVRYQYGRKVRTFKEWVSL